MRTLEKISLKDLQRQGAADLRAAGIDSATLDARVLPAHAAGLSREALVVRGDEDVAPRVLEGFAALIERRAVGEPVARILGEKEFWGLTFGLGPDTLVPRPDSECIVTAALETVADKATPLRVLDLGTGTGCLLLACLTELPNARGIGVDISGNAIAVARTNAKALNLDDRAAFRQGNWAEDLDDGPFAIILSNPPYIPADEIASLQRDVRDFDPRRALDGGADGLDCYRVILKQVPDLLAPEGQVVLETSPDVYAELCQLVGTTPNLSAPVGITDIAGRARGLRLGKDDLHT